MSNLRPVYASNPSPLEAPSLDIIEVDQKRVSCDGGGGAMGHPRVWLHLGEDNQVMCTYCSRSYVLRGSDASQNAEPQE